MTRRMNRPLVFSTIVLVYVVTLLMMVIVYFSGDDLSIIKTDNRFIAINRTANPTVDIIDYMERIDKDYQLGSIIVAFENNDVLNYEATYYFWKWGKNADIANSFIVEYSYRKGGIIRTESNTGKRVDVYDTFLNPKFWNVDFQKGAKKALEKANISKFSGMSGQCRQDKWEFTISKKASDTYDKFVFVSVDN